MNTASSASVEQTSVFNVQNPQSTLISVNMSSVTKLTNVNYLMWSKQVTALLEGHELHTFLADTDQERSLSTVNPP